ncbi:MAG: thermonuclease family protein [Bdellovibrionales bacterium]
MVLLRAIIIASLCILPAHAATVQQVIDGTTVQLDDGQVVSLAGIVGANTAQLEKVVAGKTLTLAPPLPHNRYGQAVGILLLPDGTSVQSVLVAAGQAYVFTLPETAALAATLLPVERAARAARKGRWASDFKINKADYVPYGGFAIVEGKVAAVASVKGTTYVNFGADWKTDFTVSMSGTLARTLKPKLWAGKVIRVRGWVQNKNGPHVTVTHAEQVELIP